jgi:hypothetical protein
MQRLPRNSAEAFCKGNWEPDGFANTKFGYRIFALKANCTNKLFISAVHNRVGVTPPFLELELRDRLHIGVGGMILGWTLRFNTTSGSEDDSEDGSQDEQHCDDGICTWENFEVGFRSVEFVNYGPI